MYTGEIEINEWYENGVLVHRYKVDKEGLLYKEIKNNKGKKIFAKDKKRKVKR